MGLFRTLKKNAKRALSGGWGRAILIMLIVMIPAVLVNLLEFGIREVSGVGAYSDPSGAANISPASIIISMLVGLLIFLILTPLQQGTVRWYYRRTGSENDGVTSVFYYFETAAGYFRSLWLHFLVNLRVVLWAILISTPFIAALIFYYYAVSTGRLQPSWAVGMFLLMLLAVWTLIVAVAVTLISLRYFAAPYLYAEHPELKARQAIKQSVRMMRGHKGNLFLFNLSFILWFLPLIAMMILFFTIPFSQNPLYLFQITGFVMLLAVAQLGIYFYAVPYISMSQAMYARFLIESKVREASTYADNTREYKPEIDRYLEQERAVVPVQPIEQPPEPPIEAPEPEEPNANDDVPVQNDAPDLPPKDGPTGWM